VCFHVTLEDGGSPKHVGSLINKYVFNCVLYRYFKQYCNKMVAFFDLINNTSHWRSCFLILPQKHHTANPAVEEVVLHFEPSETLRSGHTCGHTCRHHVNAVHRGEMAARCSDVSRQTHWPTNDVDCVLHVSMFWVISTAAACVFAFLSKAVL
jgi:hypothetical protein